MKRLVAFFFALALGLSAMAQESSVADDFGGWSYMQFNKSFKGGLFTSFRAEYRCKDNWSNLDFWFLRPSVGYKFSDNLSAGLCYDYRQYPTCHKHCGLAFVTGTVKSGPLSASLREMFVRSWSFDNDPASTAVSASDVLRSRLNVQYADPQTHLKPYLCIEMFTWKSWQNTRHYVGTICPLSDSCGLDLYYIYITRSNATAEHVLGAGLNIKL